MFRTTSKVMSPKKDIEKWEKKGDEVNARESVPGLIEAGYMIQFKNDAVEMEMEKADHGDMKEEVYGNFGRQWVWITASAATK